MKIETLKKGFELNERREELNREIILIRDAQEIEKKAGIKLSVTHINGGKLFTIKNMEVKEQMLDHFLKIMLKKLSDVELAIAELQDEPIS